MQKKQKIKNKKLKLFFILDKNNLYIDEKTKVPNIISVVANKRNAEEYIDKRFFIECFDHYSSWCSLRDLPIGDQSWLKYKEVQKNPYYYELTEVNYATVASLMRLFYGCTPIGCSFDTLLETSTILSKLEEEQNKIPPKKQNNEA